jgi:hypothetical protein
MSFGRTGQCHKIILATRVEIFILGTTLFKSRPTEVIVCFCKQLKFRPLNFRHVLCKSIRIVHVSLKKSAGALYINLIKSVILEFK